MSYQIFYFENGRPSSVNRLSDGASLPFYPASKTFDENDPLVIELRAWEAINGELDLSDIVIETPVLKKYILNTLLPLDVNCDVYRFPEDINYNSGLSIGLTTLTIDYFGLRVAQVFFQSIHSITKDPITPVPVVFERYTYNWDATTKLPTDRLKQIYFYYEDGTLSQQFKPLPKTFYNVSDRADIVTRRRSAIVSWLVARATELGLQAEIEAYFGLYKNETDKYILYGNEGIIDLIQNSTEAWFDTDTTTVMGTIRQAIVLCLGKALEATPDAEVTTYLSSIGY